MALAATSHTHKTLLRRYLRPEWPSVVVASTGALAMAAAASLVGILVGPCLQIIVAPRDTLHRLDTLLDPRLGGVAARWLGAEALTGRELLAILPMALGAVAGVKAILGLIQWYLWERTGERAAMALRKDLSEAFLGSDPAARRRPDVAERDTELSSAATTEARVMREYIVHFFGGLPREALQVVFLLVMLFLLSPKLTAIFLLGIAPAAAALQRLGRRLRRRASQALADYSTLTEWLQQRLLGVETIKHYRTEAVETAKMEALTTSLFDRFMRAARLKARSSPTLEAFAAVAMAVVLWVALADVASGKVAGAVLMSFFATLALLSQAAAKLGKYLNSNREGAAAIGRLSSLLDHLHGIPRKTVGADVQTAKRASIVCDRVTVQYAGASRPALADFTYTFEGGKIYCVTGPSGAGKSTLFGTLLGVVSPTSGHVRFAGAGERPAYMPQKVLLAPATLAENVAYPDASPDAARVRESLTRVGLASVVSSLPQGLDTRVGEGGAGLSGGQMQRILLARLWYRKAPWVLVDEGTSALDPEVETLVHALLRDLAAGGAVVVTIAHRRAGAEAADEVLLLEAGRLVSP